MSHKIRKVTPDRVEFEPPTQGRVPQRSLPHEKFGVTDKAVALTEGAEFEKGIPNYYITQFGPAVAADTSPIPAIDRNPYNFVDFAADRPWTFQCDPRQQQDPQYKHDDFRELSGILEFTATALTPCFIPEGFPFAEGDPTPGGRATADQLRSIERHFCQMPDSNGELCYAIPGASLKGAVRCAIEALANTRFGVYDQQTHGAPHVYRRRVFKAGILDRIDEATGDWILRQVQFSQDGEGGHRKVRNGMGLLAAQRRERPEYKYGDDTHEYFRLPKHLHESYRKLVDTEQHPHYRRHWDNEHTQDPEDKFYQGLHEGNWDHALKKLATGELIYFTAGDNKVITNFGKNVNYLWPARRSIDDLARNFKPRDAKQCKLDPSIDMADYLFGFIGDHVEDDDKTVVSHPFRGQLRVETLWGPKVAGTESVRLELAPLTSPASKAKSRPLYLAPGKDGLSASFDDADCRLRGRKFYWKQRFDGKHGVWPKHEFAGSAPHDRAMREAVRSQCPPPLLALPPKTEFQGRIHFSNLNAPALGALVMALQGDGSYPHAFSLGKAKPRGLGSFQITIDSIRAERIANRYRSLTTTSAPVELRPKAANIVAAFRLWCAGQLRKPADTPLSAMPHIADFIRLHTWPDRTSIRYYPVNFNQYNWLPADNSAQGEPRPPQKRPPAMQRARDIPKP